MVVDLLTQESTTLYSSLIICTMCASSSAEIPGKLGAPDIIQRNELFGSILGSYPPVEAAFAYGSGVFKQPDLYKPNAGNGPMIDLVFVVESERDWHAQVPAFINPSGTSCSAD